MNQNGEWRITVGCGAMQVRICKRFLVIDNKASLKLLLSEYCLIQLKMEMLPSFCPIASMQVIPGTW
jgi:hypothetical protein